MGKIVKYCAACDESFAEKFGFCPNCGQVMTAFEMSPVGREMKVAEQTKADTIVGEPAVQISAPIVSEAAPVIEPSPVAETAAAVSSVPARGFSDRVKSAIVEEDEVEPEVVPVETKTFAAAAANGNGNGNGNGNYQTSNYKFQDAADAESYKADDGGYRITVMEEKKR